jgi:hypothetical protein
MYFGRGDFGSDFSQALDYARRVPSERLAGTVTSKVVSLPVYLVAGLAHVGWWDCCASELAPAYPRTATPVPWSKKLSYCGA